MIQKKYKFFFFLFFFLFLFSFTTLFIREDPFDLFVKKIQDITSLFPSDLLLNDNWYGIYFRNKSIGYAHSSMQARERKQGGGYIVKNKTVLRIPILGVVETLNIDTNFVLDKNSKLTSADFNLLASSYFFRSNLKKTDNGKFILSVNTPSGKTKKEVSLESSLINAPFSPIFIDYVPPKKKVLLSFFDPILGRNTKVQITNVGEEKAVINGSEYQAVKFSFVVDGVEGVLYTDKDGYLLKQEFLGFEFIKEDYNDLFNKDVSFSSLDLVDSFTILSNLIIDKKDISRMLVEISGINPKELITDFNQELVAFDNVFEIRKILPKNRMSILQNVKRRDFLEETKFIKFRGNAIENVAKKIIGDELDSFEIVKLLNLWIDRNIRKIPTISIPNSLDTLKIKQGDCGEISALMTGFLRSLGIPAYVNIGLVYQEGRFFYHAWVSAYVGEWIDTDPALEQIIADATHIKLARGLEGQFSLFKFLNNLKVRVIEFE